MKFLFAIFAAAALLLAGCASVPGPKACTKEAKLCPDGSAVGRTGPNCEFAPCPSPPGNDTPPAPPPDDGQPPPAPPSGGQEDCICPEVAAPVCGADGKTYGNSCKAGCANVTVAYEGVCQVGPGPGMTKELCESASGHWNECGSACRNAPPGTSCTLQCVQQCECGGIAGFGCPLGYYCTDYEPAGAADAMGVCKSVI